MFDGKQMLQFVDNPIDSDGIEVAVYITHEYDYAFYKNNSPVKSVYDTLLLAVMIKLKYNYGGKDYNDENIQKFLEEYRNLYYESCDFERRLVVQEALMNMDFMIAQLLDGVHKDIKEGRLKPCQNSKTINLRLSNPILKD